MADELEALYYFQKAADQGHTLSQLMINLISDKQEMAQDFDVRSPLIASPFNPDRKNPNPDRKDLNHVTV